MVYVGSPRRHSDHQNGRRGDPTYTIRNVDQKAKTLILEHPLRPQYTLLNQKPAEKTALAYRFEIPLAAGASQEFAVAEERVYDQGYSVTNLTPDVLLEYVR